VRVAPEIREQVEFRRLNLIDEQYGFPEPLDIVLCRNVMIYFDRTVQQRVINRIAVNVRPGGYLLMGHSESLNGLDLPLAQIAPTIYRRPNG
jgi:chemotaxis protein methyltransferase CheR